MSRQVEWELHPGPRPSTVSARLGALFRIETVYIPHPERQAVVRDVVALPENDLRLTLSPWTCALLQGQGYHVTFRSPTVGVDDPHRYTHTAASASVAFMVIFVFTPRTDIFAAAGRGPKLEATAQCFPRPPAAFKYRPQKATFASLGRHQTAPFSDMCFGIRTVRLTLESVPGPGITVRLGVEIIESDSWQEKAIRKVLKLWRAR